MPGLDDHRQVHFGRGAQDKSWTPQRRSPKFILDETSLINLGLLKKTCVGSMSVFRMKKAILVLYPISHFSTRIFNPLIQCCTVTLKSKSFKKKVYIIRKFIGSPFFRIQGAVNRMK